MKMAFTLAANGNFYCRLPPLNFLWRIGCNHDVVKCATLLPLQLQLAIGCELKPKDEQKGNEISAIKCH